jgi:hypothetical protein
LTISPLPPPDGNFFLLNLIILIILLLFFSVLGSRFSVQLGAIQYNDVYLLFQLSSDRIMVIRCGSPDGLLRNPGDDDLFLYYTTENRHHFFLVDPHVLVHLYLHVRSLVKISILQWEKSCRRLLEQSLQRLLVV